MENSMAWEILETNVEHSVAESLELATSAADLGEIQISDRDEYEMAGEALKAVKRQARAATDDLDTFVGPLTKVINRIKARYKPALQTFARAEKQIKQAMVAYREGVVEEQKLLVQAGDLDAAEKATAPQRDGISYRTVESVVVFDLDKVPDAFITKKPKLVDIKKALKAGEKVPGARLESKTSVAVSD